MILVVGEILFDFLGVYRNKETIFGGYVGGAPFNVSYDLARLGTKTTFVGNIGEDLLGRYIVEKTRDIPNLDLRLNVRNDSDTTLAFQSLRGDGEKDFSFFRKNTADFKYDLKELKSIGLSPYDIVHFGSLFLSKENARRTLENFMVHCKENHKLLSMDVNYRADIFKSRAEALKHYRRYVPYFDILKFSASEIRMYTGKKIMLEALSCFRDNQVVFVTLGRLGGIASVYGKIYVQRRPPHIRQIDTTGAGDAFFAGALHKLVGKDISSLTKEDLIECLDFANACGALTCRVNGSLDGFKDEEQVEEFKRKGQRN